MSLELFGIPLGGSLCRCKVCTACTEGSARVDSALGLCAAPESSSGRLGEGGPAPKGPSLPYFWELLALELDPHLPDLTGLADLDLRPLPEGPCPLPLSLPFSGKVWPTDL